MNETCKYKLVGGQFCGGFFWETECGHYIPIEDFSCTICPECGSLIVEIEDE